jgi:hypothetical protein
MKKIDNVTIKSLFAYNVLEFNIMSFKKELNKISDYR